MNEQRKGDPNRGNDGATLSRMEQERIRREGKMDEQEYLNGPDGSGDRRAQRTEAAAKGIDAFERELRAQQEVEDMEYATAANGLEEGKMDGSEDMMGDIIKHKPYSITDSKGNSYRVVLRQIAPTLRFEVIVEGECVGWGFATREDAEARAYDAIREDRWSFSRTAAATYFRGSDAL